MAATLGNRRRWADTNVVCVSRREVECSSFESGVVVVCGFRVASASVVQVLEVERRGGVRCRKYVAECRVGRQQQLPSYCLFCEIIHPETQGDTTGAGQADGRSLGEEVRLSLDFTFQRHGYDVTRPGHWIWASRSPGPHQFTLPPLDSALRSSSSSVTCSEAASRLGDTRSSDISSRYGTTERPFSA